MFQEPEKGETSNQGGETQDVSNTPNDTGKSLTEDSHQEDSEHDEEYDSEDSEDLQEYQLVRDRAKREIRLPKRYTDSDIVGFALSMTEDGGRPEPKSYEEALNDPDWEKWKMAVDEEMGFLHKKETFLLVKKPKKEKVIDCKWVYRKKSGFAGDIGPRFKAKLWQKDIHRKRE